MNIRQVSAFSAIVLTLALFPTLVLADTLSNLVSVGPGGQEGPTNVKLTKTQKGKATGAFAKVEASSKLEFTNKNPDEELDSLQGDLAYNVDKVYATKTTLAVGDFYAASSKVEAFTRSVAGGNVTWGARPGALFGVEELKTTGNFTEKKATAR